MKSNTSTIYVLLRYPTNDKKFQYEDKNKRKIFLSNVWMRQTYDVIIFVLKLLGPNTRSVFEII